MLGWCVDPKPWLMSNKLKKDKNEQSRELAELKIGRLTHSLLASGGVKRGQARTLFFTVTNHGGGRWSCGSLATSNGDNHSTFDTINRAAITAVAFWTTTSLKGQFVTPAIIGKTLKVGPVVVLISVAFRSFVWSLPGVFLAVPLLIVQRKVFASFDATFPIAVVLGEPPRLPQRVCEPFQETMPIARLAK